LDHLEIIKTMSIRRLVMWGFLGLGAALLAVVGVVWLYPGVSAHLIVAVAVIVLTAAVWAIAFGVGDGGAGGVLAVHPFRRLAQRGPLGNGQRHTTHEIPDQFAENGGSGFHLNSEILFSAFRFLCRINSGKAVTFP
jgi:hypothetical protein